MSKLHKTKDWEDHIPAGARYEEFSYNKDGEVKKVVGYLLLKQKVHATGKFVEARVKCHWDGFGKCFVKGEKRKRGYDVIFEKEEENGTAS